MKRNEKKNRFQFIVMYPTHTLVSQSKLNVFDNKWDHLSYGISLEIKSKMQKRELITQSHCIYNYTLYNVERHISHKKSSNWLRQSKFGQFSRCFDNDDDDNDSLHECLNSGKWFSQFDCTECDKPYIALCTACELQIPTTTTTTMTTMSWWGKECWRRMRTKNWPQPAITI